MNGTVLGLNLAKRFITVLGCKIGYFSKSGARRLFCVQLSLEMVSEPQIKASNRLILPKTSPQKYCC
ncbi:MAG: hypothetical protein ACI94O_002413 [Octadecabacter sp.]|jgi:hypothetical protein